MNASKEFEVRLFDPAKDQPLRFNPIGIAC
jgi:hypothetical protein